MSLLQAYSSYAPAEVRIRKALERVELAQNELNAACSDLSAVIGMVKPWEDCGKLADKVKAFWHKLHGKFLSKDVWELDKI